MMRQRQAATRPTAKTDWPAYITKILAFIGLWQVISNSAQFLNHWF
jgi:hypothetical protein